LRRDEGARSGAGALSATRRLLIAYLILGGSVSLLGWIADVPRLTDWIQSGISIQPNACLAVISSGIALALLALGRRRAAAAIGGFVALIGVTVLVQYATKVDLGIDTLLMFDHAWGRVGVISPGRMGPPGAMSWTLIGVATFLAALPPGSRARRLAPALALATGSISALGLIGYLYRAGELYTVPTLTVIALQTGTFILVASITILTSVPEHGPMRLLRDRGMAGMLVRRILPAVVVLPVLLGFLRLSGERAGLYDSAFGSALRTIVEIALFMVLLWWAASAIKRQSERRARADAALAAELGDSRLLQRISTELIRRQEPEKVYESIVDAASRIMRSEFASLQVLHPERGAHGELALLAHRGFDADAAESWRWIPPESRTTCGRALRTGKRVVVPDVHASEDLAASGELAVYARTGIRSVQTTPLVSRNGTLVGMISTHWRSVHEPSERDLRLFDILARQATDLIERRRSETERDELLERERSARSEAERAARLKDEFLATLSHELRTPLNAVIGWSQILKKDLHDPERVRVAVEVIERNGRLQAQLITDLLDISAIISGKMRLDVQKVELPAVIEAAVESMQPAAEAKGILIQRILEAAPPIHGDPARLQQIVWNLLSNAVKFTPHGGRVQIVMRTVGTALEIRVSDSGEGIQPEFLPHIFERFRQANASTSRAHGGLGLGLALVKQFTELHGGSVRAFSEGKGKGATFVLRLPFARSDAATGGRTGPHRSEDERTDPGRRTLVLEGVRVLLVDDEPDALSFVRRTLEDHEATVRTARDAADALAILREEAFDVIVSDIGMAGRDGYEMMGEARRRGVRTPAIALTAFARAEDRAKAIASGYQAHLAKPMDAPELLATIASLARRSGEEQALESTDVRA
jgi:signal transduction histidine kinase/CheY-like chemotaxis protein